MKEINLYIRGVFKNKCDAQEGRYVAILEYNNKFKLLTGKEIETTSNRMLIKAALEGIKCLKEPCKINLYTPTNIGFKTKKSPNQGLIDELKMQIEAGGHIVTEIISATKQNELIKILRTAGYK